MIILFGDDVQQTTLYYYGIKKKEQTKNGEILPVYQEFDITIYLADCLDQIDRCTYLIFENLKKKKFIDLSKVTQYFYFPTSQAPHNGYFINENTKEKLTILYNDQTQKYLHLYKKEYQTDKVFHFDNIDDAIRQFRPNLVLKDTQIAVLLGNQGVGKSVLFEKLTGIKNQNKKDFADFAFENFQLIDSPSFNLEQDVPDQDELIETYMQFFHLSQEKISTFFLLIKYDRFDLMKESFFSVFGQFQKFRKQIVVVITDWEKSKGTQQKEQYEKCSSYFRNVACVRNVIFLEDMQTSDVILQEFQRNLVGVKGIDLTDTIFSIKQTQEDEQFQQNMEQNIKKIEQTSNQNRLKQNSQKKQDLLYLNQTLLQDKTNLKNELERKMQELKREYSEKILLKTELISYNKEQIKLIDKEIQELNYEAKKLKN